MTADTGRSEWRVDGALSRRPCGDAELFVRFIPGPTPGWRWAVELYDSEPIKDGMAPTEAEAKHAAEAALSEKLNAMLVELCGAGWVVATRSDKELGHGMRKDAVALREDGAVRAAFLTYERAARETLVVRSGKGAGKALDAALANLLLELRRVLA